MRAAALLMGVLLLTAGCLGIGGDDSDADTSSVDDVDTNTSQAGNASATEDHAHEAQPEKHFVNITGEISGVNVVIGTNAVGNETIPVPDTAQSLEIAVTAEGGELNVDILPPECTNEAELLGTIDTGPPSCAESGSTANGTAEQISPDGGTYEFSTQSPEGGNWTVEMSKEDAGASAVSYTIQGVYVDVHAPGPDHHS